MTAQCAAEREGRQRGWRSVLHYALRNQSVLVGGIIVLVLATLSLGAPIFSSPDPTTMNASAILQSPSREHLFGTDVYGRDLFAWVLHGSRLTFLVGLEVAAITTVLGIILGILAATYSWLDSLIMRFLDILMSFPMLLMAIGIVAILGPRLLNIVIALVIPLTPRAARIIRGCCLELREKEYVLSARALGAGKMRIAALHLLPNALAPLIVQQTYTLALSMLSESGLSFLGVGMPPDVPTLGTTLAIARSYLRSAPWLSLYPGLFITLMVLGFNTLGDGLRDVLDPRLRHSE